LGGAACAKAARITNEAKSEILCVLFEFDYFFFVLYCEIGSDALGLTIFSIAIIDKMVEELSL